jgi:hypothetical protein
MILAVVFLVFATISAGASCDIRGVWMFGQHSTETLQIIGSAVCGIRATPGRGTDVKSIAITQKPSHGSVSWSGSLVDIVIFYRPNPGYKGSDEFAYAVTGTRMSTHGSLTPLDTANITTSVDIQ